MPPTSPSPVVRVLNAILREKKIETCQVLSYRDQFDKVWRIIDEFPKCEQRNLIIVWDGVPESAKALGDDGPAINITDHVTVFDWLVALCCKAGQRLRNRSAQESPDGQETQSGAETDAAGQTGDSTPDLPNLRLFILDLAPPQHSTAFGVRTFLDFLPRLPWVRVYRPVARFDGQVETLVGACGGEKDFTALLRTTLGPQSLGITQLLAEAASVGKTDLPEAPTLRKEVGALPEVADRLRGLWINELTKAGDRHSLSNIIGVRILLKGMKVETLSEDGAGEHLVFGALEKLMGALGLLPESKKPDGKQEEECVGTWFAREKWYCDLDSFVLVDDMHNLGWREFLKAALGCEDGALKACDRPDGTGFGSNEEQSLMNLLMDEEGRLLVNRERERGLTLCGMNKKEVLFLDLRLFANRGKAQEIQFFKELLKLAEQAPEDREELAWEGFSSKDLAAIRRCIESRSESTDNDDYFVALTLLPRLISLVVPWVPIVLFSSTGQRRVVDRLKAHGNVITEFDKPRFFGDSSTEVVVETKAKFQRAMERAVALARSRQVCLKLLSHKRSALAAEVSSRDNHKYVEVYIDESGTDSERMTVGGLAVFYPSKEYATAFATVLRKEGFVWGYDCDSGEEVPETYLLKGSETEDDEARETLLKLSNLMGKMGLKANTFALHAFPNTHGHQLFAQSCPDQVFRSLLQRVIEIVLFLWRPGQEQNIEIAIHAGTRTYQPRNMTNQDVRRRWGMGVLEGSNRNFVFSTSDVYPIVQAVLGLHEPVTMADDEVAVGTSAILTAARAFVLRDYKYSSPPRGDFDHNRSELPRQMHYVADWIASCGGGNPRYRLNAAKLMQRWHDIVPQKWQEHGFRDVWDDDFDHLLQGARFSELPARRVDAIIEWALVRRELSGNVDHWATEQVARCVGDLTGKDFIDLAIALPRLPLSPRGRITKLSERGFGFIATGGEDVFFHMSVLRGTAFSDLTEGTAVEYEIAQSRGKGRQGPRASSVRVIG